jgi:hypothetical protein
LDDDVVAEILQAHVIAPVAELFESDQSPLLKDQDAKIAQLCQQCDRLRAQIERARASSDLSTALSFETQLRSKLRTVLKHAQGQRTLIQNSTQVKAKLFPSLDSAHQNARGKTSRMQTQHDEELNTIEDEEQEIQRRFVQCKREHESVVSGFMKERTDLKHFKQEDSRLREQHTAELQDLLQRERARQQRYENRLNESVLQQKIYQDSQTRFKRAQTLYERRSKVLQKAADFHRTGAQLAQATADFVALGLQIVRDKFNDRLHSLRENRSGILQVYTQYFTEYFRLLRISMYHVSEQLSQIAKEKSALTLKRRLAVRHNRLPVTARLNEEMENLLREEGQAQAHLDKLQQEMSAENEIARVVFAEVASVFLFFC